MAGSHRSEVRGPKRPELHREKEARAAPRIPLGRWLHTDQSTGVRTAVLQGELPERGGLHRARTRRARGQFGSRQLERRASECPGSEQRPEKGTAPWRTQSAPD